MCCGACSFKRGGHWWFSAARRAPLLQSRSWEQIYLVAFGYLIRSICICFSLACYLIWPYLVDFCRYLIRIWSKYQIYLIFECYTGWLRSKRLAKRRTLVEGVSTRTLLAATMAYASGACCYTPAQAAETTTFRGNTGSTATPKTYSWTRPGIFRVRALPPPAGAQATRAAGPGLPTGGKTADYD